MLALLENVALYVVPFLLIITFIVTIHELGHFLTARAFRVAVDRFSIGFGRAILSLRDKWGVEWRIAWLPLGGYVRFAGDENMASVPDQDDLAELRARIAAREGVGAEKRYFPFKPLWQRALIVAAGPGANFVLAIAIFAALIVAFGDTAATMRIREVLPGDAAAAAGVRVGDLIEQVDGRPIKAWDDFAAYIQDRPGERMTLTIDRGGRLFDLPLTAGVNVVKNPMGGTVRIGLLGLSPEASTERLSPIGATGRAAEKTWSVVARTGQYVGRLAQGKADWPFGGIIGISHATATITHEDFSISQSEHANIVVLLLYSYGNIAALLSISVGLVNLLPIPVLDGGHLLFYAYEGVARRPLAASAQAAGYRVGLALLVGLMLFTTWHDLQRLQVFHFLGGLFS
jgi:regulator of sigma E protease